MNTLTRLDRSDVKQYPKRVADLLMILVNECFISCRPIDGQQMLLYPPDGVSRPFKVIARRGEVATLGFIEKQFIAKYGIRMPEKKKEKAEVPDPTLSFQPQPPKQESTVESPEFSAKQEPPVSPKPEPKATALPPHPEGEPDTTTVWRTLMHSKTGEPMPNWETNGVVFRCVVCRKNGKEWSTSERRGVAGHSTAHTEGQRRAERGQAVLPLPERTASAPKSPVENVEQALAVLQDALGVQSHREAAEAADRRIAELEAEITSLREQLSTETKRADDAVARLDLIREGLNA